MKIRNLRTGVVGEVRPNVAKFLIATGKCVEVKNKVLKQEPEKKAEKEEKKPASKKTYKTKDMKAEA